MQLTTIVHLPHKLREIDVSMMKVVSTARRADAVRCIGCGINGQLWRGVTLVGHKWKPYIVHQTRITILVPRPKLSIASSDRELYISSADWKSYVASYAFLCSSQARFCKWKFQAAISFKPAFSFRGPLRIDRRYLKNTIYLAWFRTTWLLLTTHLDSCASAISGTFWIYCIVSASLLNLCWRSYCNVRLLTEHQVRLFYFFKPNKIILGWHLWYH